MPYRPFRVGDRVRVVIKAPEHVLGEFENVWADIGAATGDDPHMSSFLPGGLHHQAYTIADITRQGVKFAEHTRYRWPPAALMHDTPELAVGDLVRVVCRPSNCDFSEGFNNVWTYDMGTYLPGGVNDRAYRVASITGQGVAFEHSSDSLDALGFCFPPRSLRVERPPTTGHLVASRDELRDLITRMVPSIDWRSTGLIRRRVGDVDRDNGPNYRQMRYGFLSPVVIATRKRLRRAGRSLAGLITAFRVGEMALDEVDHEEVADWLNAVCEKARAGSYATVCRALDEVGYCIADHLTHCADCGELFELDSSALHTALGDTVVCDGCIDSYTYSCAQGVYIRNPAALPVFTSVRDYENGVADDHVSMEYAHQHYYGTRDIGFFTDLEDWHEVTCGGDEAEYEDDGLSDYHRARRHFVEDVSEPALGPALGVELEVYAQDNRRDTVGYIRDAFPQLILERDGSLDDYHGFEIVTQPLGVPEWGAFAGRMLTHLQRGNVVAYNGPAGDGYGIHVNIHRRHFSPLAEARIMMLLCADMNRDFVRAIAQREGVYDADVDIGEYFAEGLRVVTAGSALHDGVRETPKGLRYPRKISGKGKYAPVNWQYDIAEFRIFQSTLSLDSFMKNLEFVWALHAWTKPESATGNSFDHRDFVRWLNTSARRKQYPHLVKYLSRKSYTIKGGRMILSGWQSLMAKPSDEDFVEQDAA